MGYERDRSAPGRGGDRDGRNGEKDAGGYKQGWGGFAEPAPLVVDPMMEMRRRKREEMQVCGRLD